MKALNTVLIIIIFISNAMSQTNGKYANVNGLKMYYEIHGKGYPLILIHGGGSTIETTFGRILPDLAKQHQVIAVELQAHGRTADIDRALSFDHDASDVAALLKQLGISKADIFGFSNGASTALTLAIKYPELVNKIIIASTMYKKSGAYPWLWEMMKTPSFDQMPKQLKEGFLAVNPDQNALLSSYKRDVARMQSFTDMNEEDIKGIKAPTLIIAGDKDVVTPEHAVEMSRQIPDARLLIWPGGHGDYIGEITTATANDGYYPVLSAIEEFLKEK